MSVYDFLFDDRCIATSSSAAPRNVEAVSAERSAGVNQPEDEEEASHGTKDDADYGARCGTGVEALVCSRYGEDLGLALREEEGRGWYGGCGDWLSRGKLSYSGKGIEGTGCKGRTAVAGCEMRRD